MTCVVVYADASDKDFFDKLCGMVSGRIPHIKMWKGEASPSGEPAEFIITDHESFGNFDAAPDNVVFIADSQNHERLEYISGTKLPAITCGLFAKDSITLSSIESDSAVINLQRSITCFNGDIAEPQEIPVRFKGPMDSYLLMAAAAIFILTGNSDLMHRNYQL